MGESNNVQYPRRLNIISETVLLSQAGHLVVLMYGIHVVQVLFKSSDTLKDSSVIYTVVDQLFVECFNGVIVFLC